MDLKNQSRSEELHHECDPAERLTKLERFRDGIKALLAELEGAPEISLNESDMRKLEGLGALTFPRRFRERD